MTVRYMRSKDGVVTATEDLIAWAQWYEENTSLDETGFLDSARCVARDVVGNATVSTVFLSLDHRFIGSGPPILWETMVFGGPHSEYQERYITEASAKRRHADIVKRLREGKAP